MNFFKLFFIFSLLFSPTFPQRFFRHSNNESGFMSNGMDSDNLASDVSNVEQVNDDVKLVGYGEEIKLELKSDVLQFKFCSEGCLDKNVIVCFDAINNVAALRGRCGPNQCEFKAGISPQSTINSLWFKMTGIQLIRQFDKNEEICETAMMKSPDAVVSFGQTLDSCDPLLIDGNVVKLFVKKATRECSLTVMNAKLWTPTTPSPTTSEAPDSEGEEETSNATTIWIIVGVGLFVLVIIIIALGFVFFIGLYMLTVSLRPDISVWYYCTRMKKKTGNGKNGKTIVPESQKTNVEAAVVATKAEDKKEVVKQKEKKEDTKEKKETVEETKPKKKDIQEMKTTVEEKKAEPKALKEVTENEKVDPQKKANVEPTVDDPTTVASIVQPNNHFPTVQVPKTQILPAPKSCGSKGDSHSSKKGSLSGRHEVGMQIMVESPPDSVKRHCFGLIDDAAKEKLEKFYPSGSSTRVFEKREILLFCCSRVSIMFKGIEILIDMAIDALAERDVKFDDKDNIVEMSPEAEKYLRQKSTPEITRSFAFGSVFRDLIDSRADVYESYSIPLLFCIVLQRRYTVLNRRKAFIWIRRQLPIIYAEFSLKERKKLAYPINAIEEMHKLDPEGFKDVAGFHTESGMEEGATQASTTRASEKNRKKESGGKKKSKKRP